MASILASLRRWKSMELQKATIVVSGGTGFLGSHVTEELKQAGATALGLGSRDYDLRRRTEIARMLRDLRPDARRRGPLGRRGRRHRRQP